MIHKAAFLLWITTTYAWPRLSGDDLGTRISSSAETDPWTSLSCNFDDSTLCSWTNGNGEFPWTLGLGKDSFRRRGRTGTKSDATGGYYIYISADRRRNRTALLMSPRFKQTETACLTFQYHMRGRHIGYLRVYDITLEPMVATGTYQPHSTKILWHISGAQGTTWLKGQVEVPILDATKTRQLAFEALDWEAGRAGNIALDDISYIRHSQNCLYKPPWAAPPTMPTPTVFETTGMSSKAFQFEETSTAMKHSATSLTPQMSFSGDSTTDPEETTIPIKATTITRQFQQTDTNTIEATTPLIHTANTTPIFEQTVTPARGTTKLPVERVSSPFVHSTITDGRVYAVQTTVKASRATPKLEDGVNVKNPDSSQNNTRNVAIGVSAGVALLVICVGALLCYRRRKRGRFDYYDNCTVHMARIAADDAKQDDGDMQYYKLT